MKFYLSIIFLLFVLEELNAKNLFNKFLGADGLINKYKKTSSLQDYINMKLIIAEMLEMKPNVLRRKNNVFDKVKNLLKIKIYYDPIFMPDGTIHYVPKDANQNHHFIG